MNQISITAIVIAKNEQRNLPAALESVSFCDEIILVDNGSTDESVKKLKKINNGKI